MAYTTKYRTTDKVAKNTKNESAYIDVGDPYVKALAKNSRATGKQFITEPPKNGQTGKLFSKFPVEKEAYTEIKKYSVIEPRKDRKPAFGSGDASKRDEFLITMREGQWKELVDQELSMNTASLAAREENARAEAATLPAVSTPASAPEKPSLPHFQTMIPKHLYDIGNTVEGSTPHCIKCQRETFFCKHRSLARNGEIIARRPTKHFLTSMDMGRFIEAKDHARPEYAYQHKAKDFYDSGHLTLKA
jgi:hypothetical protein